MVICFVAALAKIKLSKLAVLLILDLNFILDVVPTDRLPDGHTEKYVLHVDMIVVIAYCRSITSIKINTIIRQKI